MMAEARSVAEANTSSTVAVAGVVHVLPEPRADGEKLLTAARWPCRRNYRVRGPKQALEKPAQRRPGAWNKDETAPFSAVVKGNFCSWDVNPRSWLVEIRCPCISATSNPSQPTAATTAANNPARPRKLREFFLLTLRRCAGPPLCQAKIGNPSRSCRLPKNLPDSVTSPPCSPPSRWPQ